ncbi:MAG: PCRF domain-containing protein, partial [Clostridia bacterium]|nr:PCRF domain-containing protein [Clostridia bacterium]
MIERLKKIKERFDELTKDLIDPDVLADMSVWQKKSKEQSDLAPIVEKFDEYLKVSSDMKDAEEMLKTETDADMLEMLNDEFYSGKEKLKEIEEELKILLLPKDENDEGNVIVEIRAGVGGDEAGIFAGDLFRMYTMFADRNNFKVEVLDENAGENGVIKEISFMVTGKGAYAKFKYESGVHRVQRVPVTESSGRIHTSASTVAVLPEAKNVQI